MGVAGLFCYQWTDLPASAVSQYCAPDDAGGAVMSACPTGSTSTCSFTQSGGSYSVYSYTSCANAKASCAGGSGSFDGGC
jgi:hypothetical protein